ncbi:MAG: hypothetical protein ACRDZX_05210 [Acidimicrobiales bacterium]
MSSDDRDATLYPFTPAPPPPADGLGPPPVRGGQQATPPRRRRSRIGKTAAGLALIVGTGAGAATVALASAGGRSPALASADSGTTPTTASPSTGTTTPRPSRRGGFPGRLGPSSWGLFGGFMAGPGGPVGGESAPGVVHASYTVKGPDGKYETIDMQYGTVEAVSSSSVTVKSADGFSQTYQVAPTSVVDAGPTGISSVKVGDEVNVQGVAGANTVTAERVDDLTRVAANRKSWAPSPAVPPWGPGGGPTTTPPAA